MNWTAFKNNQLLASGPAADVAIAVRRAMDMDRTAEIHTFDDATGCLVDFDTRGTDAEIADRLSTRKLKPTPAVPRSVGRPKLGVVAKEVTLLPRHWEWLAGQPASASATIRSLIDAERKLDNGKSKARIAQATADRFMRAKLGNQPGYEEASRALYAQDQHGFIRLSQSWPTDLRNYALRLAIEVFE